jgi:predicted NAD/FAD-dependent oxidoreductase
MEQQSVAIVGGGIAGAVAAATLAKAGLAVTVFDQGRRGPGGRASHRTVADDGRVLPDDEAPPAGAGALEFDHGCQFFRADDPRMQQGETDRGFRGLT